MSVKRQRAAATAWPAAGRWSSWPVVDQSKVPVFTTGLENAMYTEGEKFLENTLWGGGKVSDLLVTQTTFVNADLTIVVWRQPCAPWILLSAQTHVGDQGTGVARGTLSDVDGAFGACEQTLLFERRAQAVRDGG